MCRAGACLGSNRREETAYQACSGASKARLSSGTYAAGSLYQLLIFNGALQKVEARRQSRSNTGGTASTNRFEK